MVNDTIAKNENEDVPKKKIEQEHDVPESKEVFSCNLCDFETETKDELETHKRQSIHDVNTNKLDNVGQ